MSAKYMKYYMVGNWLFLIGCLIFTFDASLSIAETISLRSICQFSGSIAFTLGCIFFLLDTPR
jgi:hypothetical protein